MLVVVVVDVVVEVDVLVLVLVVVVMVVQTRFCELLASSTYPAGQLETQLPR